MAQLTIRVQESETIKKRLKRLALERDETQGETLEAALTALEAGDAMKAIGGAIAGSLRKQTKKEKVAADLAATDLTAQVVGRDDIEYGSHEVAPKGQHVANLDAVGSPLGGGRGKATVETWRKGREPLLKPSEKKR